MKKKKTFVGTAIIVGEVAISSFAFFKMNFWFICTK